MAVDFKVRPQIYIYLTATDLQPSIKDLLYGIEEEGIPFEIVEQVNEKDVIAAAYEAAKTSSLMVGVGCDGEKLVLHYKNLASQRPYLLIDRYQTKPKQLIKDFGSNCARLVKGVSFKDVEGMEVTE